MAGLSQRHLGTIAAGAVAVTVWCAAAAGGGAGVAGLDMPLLVLAPALAGVVVVAATRRSLHVLPPGKDVVVLTAVTVAGFVGVYLADWTSRAHQVDIARLLPLVVVALGVLWPEPNVLRYSLLLAAGTLLGTVGEQVTSRAAVGGALAATALALVVTNRLTAAAGPRFGEAPPARARRVAGEAAAVLVAVGLLAALASSLLPPPAGRGGGDGTRRSPLPQPAAPALDASSRLDVTPGRGAPSADVVLLVDTAKADLWRATTYDHWDGEIWSQSSSARALVAGAQIGPGTGDDAASSDSRPSGTVQRVTVLAQSAGVLPAAARPVFVSSRAPLREGVDATLYPTVALARGDRYIVSSDGSQARAQALRGAGDLRADTVPAAVAGAYLQLPEVEHAVRALAAQLAGRRPTTYDKVRAIESWIRENTTDTAGADPVPAGTDAVEGFLFGPRSGPAERAATSMVVMLRSLGVPARLAVGFLPGARTGTDRAFLVRSRDAHAWVEVWFPNAGWQRFDPTGKAPDAHAGGETVWDRLLRFLRRLWPLAVAVGLVALAWLAWTGARWRRRRAALPWATRYFARVERAGAARGRPRRPQETPAEYTAELAVGVLPDARLAEVGALVTAAAWSAHEPGAEPRARAEQVLREATRATPARRLRRLARPTPSEPPHGPTIPKP